MLYLKRANCAQYKLPLKKGVKIAVADLVNVLSFLKAENDDYSLNLESIKVLKYYRKEFFCGGMYGSKCKLLTKYYRIP